jgi:glyoxylase-like metal-dependent hydrolase (beta-lactamase superfamily II)
VVRRVLQACGVTRALRTLPFGVAYALASVLEWAGRLTGREPSLTRYTAAVLGRTQTYDLTAARRDLGYAPVVSLDAGIEQTLAAFAPPTPARWFVPTAVQQRVEVLTTGYCTAQRGHVLRGGGATQIQCQALVVLLQHPQHGWWLFDTGYAPRLLDATARLPFRLYRWATPLHLRPELAVAAQLPRFGIAPADIGTVVLSHFHADHLAGVRDMPAARFVARQTAYADVAERRGLAALRRAFVPSLLPTDFAQRATLLPAFTGPSLGELGPTHDLFGDGSALLVELPGHAVGQLGLFVTSPRGPLLFVADAAWLSESIRTNTPPPGLVRLIVADYAALCATIGKLHRFAQAHPDVAIIPCHCPEAFARWVA